MKVLVNKQGRYIQKDFPAEVQQSTGLVRTAVLYIEQLYSYPHERQFLKRKTWGAMHLIPIHVGL